MMAQPSFFMSGFSLFLRRRRKIKVNKKMNVKIVAMNAMIACVYAVMTMACSGIAYGAIQFRLSEVFVFLAFYNKKFIPGLVIGCFLANIISPLGLADMLFGTLATLFACLAMYKAKNLYLGAILGALINGLIVGIELYWILGLPFFINAVYVMIGEFLVLIIGVILFNFLEKNKVFMKKYILCEESSL